MLDAGLLQAATGCTAERAALFAPLLDAACLHYRIDTPVRLAAFLAQVGHESEGLVYMAELWGPTPQQRRYERDPAHPWPSSAAEARLAAFAVNRLAYTLGNTQPGDGKRYRGRGLIQITGRANYTATTQRMQPAGAPDFVDFPEALEEPHWAAWSACDWWAAHGCNELADAEDFDALTRRINGGTNGIEDRRRRWEKAKTLLLFVQPPTTTMPAGEAPSWQPPPEKQMAPFLLAALPSIIEAIPKLGRVFGSGSQVSERNLKAAELVAETVKAATGAATEQEAVQRLQSDPAAVQAASKAIDAVWYELTEAGGGGIDGARKAEAARNPGGDLLHSASFWVGLLLLPLVYLIVLSLIGLVGTATWSDDVRAGLAGSLISAIVGGLVGYYYGTSTSRNRAPP